MSLTKCAVVTISSCSRVLLKALNERDGFTRRHCDRVIALAGSFGRACGLSSMDLRGLRLSARFHDIGKIGIPDQVLLKLGRLAAEECAVMRTHPERGQRIIESIGIDGSGYPDGLAGDDIPYAARMVSIVDGYDAMADSRPYHPGRPHEEIMGIMQTEVGHKYDPYLFDRFAAMIVDSNRKAPAA